jgi:hypothetical protein
VQGDFVLKVHSTAPPQHIKLIPAEGEGMARQVQSRRSKGFQMYMPNQAQSLKASGLPEADAK